MKIFNLFWLPLLLGLIMAGLSSCQEEDRPRPRAELTKEQAYETVTAILTEALEEPVVRKFIKDKALERYTYDYEVIYGMVKDQALDDGRTLAGIFANIEQELLKANTITAPVVADLQQLLPLMSINVPQEIFSWETDNFLPPVILNPDDQAAVGYVIGRYASANSVQISLKELPDYPLITLADNERVIFYDGQYLIDPSLILAVAPAQPSLAKNDPIIECFMFGDEEICIIDGGSGPPPPTGNADCPRGWNMYTYITGIRMTNVGSFETFGRPELRALVFGGVDNIFAGNPSGTLIVDPQWNPDRRDVNGRWWNTTHYLLRWYEDYGSRLTFRWEEVDTPLFGGGGTTVSFNFNVTYNGQNYGVDATFPRGNGDDYIGTSFVDKNGCPREYSVGALQWRMQF